MVPRVRLVLETKINFCFRDEFFNLSYELRIRYEYTNKNMESEIIYKELSYKIVGISFEVFNELGYGYKEKHYEKIIEKYLLQNNIKFHRQAPYKINFKGEIIGTYYMDFIIEDKIVLEIKQENYFSRNNIGQINGYLRATGLKLGLLINFTQRGVKYIRIVNLPNYSKK